MASESHRHGDKWIKHNLTVIDKDGAHQTEGGNPGARRSNSLRSFGIGALTAQLRR